MKSVFKPVWLAGLLATAGFAAFAQAPAGGECAGMMGQGGPLHEGMRHDMGKMDPAKMQARMDKRSTELKTKLKLTPAQEGAWTTFTAAMKPSAAMLAKRPDHAELDKLPLPERIDKMKALRTQRMADMGTAMDQRGEAAKTFYATLTSEQQKVFDANAMQAHGSESRMGGARDGKGPAQPSPGHNSHH